MSAFAQTCQSRALTGNNTSYRIIITTGPEQRVKITTSNNATNARQQTVLSTAVKADLPDWQNVPQQRTAIPVVTP